MNSESISAIRSKRIRRLVLMVLAPCCVIAISIGIYLHGGRYVETDNAYVKADKVPLSSDVSGTVLEVSARENQEVQAGQLLFRIDPASFRIAAAKAEAKLAQTRTDIASLKASYHEKKAELALTRTRVEFSARDWQRQENLASKGFLSAAKLDEARQLKQIAEQEQLAKEHDLTRIAESLGGDVNMPIEEHPSYLAALAELEQARLDLARVEVRAPLPGRVSNLPKPGQYASAGSTAMTLVVDGNLWIEANFPEKDLTHVQPGQRVEVRFDIYPSKSWNGVVESLSPATGSEFSVLPAQNATGNWVKVSQRIPVRIRLEAQAEAPPLRAGLSAIVEVDTNHRRSLSNLLL
ncbi:HlyD family secretion protein [Pseudomonas sp. BN414]|uniref:HlyD family secretion protein n=1 Tax=Pseudomonas sp. BN414 TaxID=2567888 RepID=UPI002453C8E6|nr:HlyD family secretion protein [Pseudomonas sp. BN414]MDH4565238.1 HlyD family secretion protein [Pseudomonas sp. BN414]